MYQYKQSKYIKREHSDKCDQNEESNKYEECNKDEDNKCFEPYLKLIVPPEIQNKNAARLEVIMDHMPVIDMAGTGNNITRLRIANGFSVRDLQDIFGFSTPQAIYKWQHGTALPSVDNLVVLASLFHVHIDEILIIENTEAMQVTA